MDDAVGAGVAGVASLPDPVSLTLAERDASVLFGAATVLDEAATHKALEQALDYNLRLWVAIRAIALSDAPFLPPDTKANLVRLFGIVADTTFKSGQAPLTIADVALLAKIDLELAQGLLEGRRTEAIRERAYQIWEAQGCPDGHARAHWSEAEGEIDAYIGRRVPS